jgi:hypothetical protein
MALYTMSFTCTYHQFKIGFRNNSAIRLSNELDSYGNFVACWQRMLYLDSETTQGGESNTLT